MVEIWFHVYLAGQELCRAYIDRCANDEAEHELDVYTRNGCHRADVIKYSYPRECRCEFRIHEVV